MTVYFAGGEDVDFAIVATSGLYRTTNTINYRAAFARDAKLGNSDGPASSTWPPSGYISTPNWGPASSFWAHAQWGEGNITSNNYIMLALMDSSGIGRILIRGTGTTGQLKISTRNAAGTIVDLVTGSGTFPASSSGAPVPIDVFVNYSTSGQVTVYANGSIVADTGTGVNVTTDGVTALSQLLLSGPSGGPWGWTEVIVQDTSTIGAALWTLTPAASGNTQSWTPNTVADINATSISDTTFVNTTAASQLSEWTTNYTPPTGQWVVEAIVQSARLSVGSTGPQTFEWLLRTTDGSDHVSGSNSPIQGTFSNFSNEIWPNNPHTGSAWVITDIATGFNIGIESTT